MLDRYFTSVFERGKAMRHDGRRDNALVLFGQCAKGTQDKDLLLNSVLEITGMIIDLDQVFAAYCICSWCDRIIPKMSPVLKKEAEIVQVLKGIQERLHTEHEHTIRQREISARKIITRLLQLNERSANNIASSIAQSLFYMSSTLDHGEDVLPLFHSFRMSIPLLDGSGNVVMTFSPYLELFEWAADRTLEQRFSRLSERVDENCGLGASSLCFARGRENDLGLLLTIKPSDERQYWHFLASVLPPFELRKLVGGNPAGDMVPGAYACINLGIKTEIENNYDRASSWYGVAAAASSASGDLESTLIALVHLVRNARRQGDETTAGMALKDIEAGLAYRNIPRVSLLIEKGFLDRLDLANSSRSQNPQ
jgi:hypothetical protein